MKLRNKIILMTGGAVVLSVLAITLLVNLNVGRLLTEQIESKQTELVTETAKTFNQWLSIRQEMLVSLAATTATVDAQDSRTTLQLLTTVAKGGKFMESYIGYDDGRFLDSSGWQPPADYDPRTRPWYKAATDEGKAILTKPYIDANTGKMIISFAAPVFKNGHKVAVVSGDIELTYIVDSVLKINVGEHGYALLADQAGNIVVHPDKEMTNKSIPAWLKEGFEQTRDKTANIREVSNQGQKIILASAAIPSANWYLLAMSRHAEMYAPLRQLLYIMTAIGATFVLIGIVMAFLIGRNIANPIGQTVEMISELEKGHLNIRLDLDRKDEIGLLATTMNTFADNLQKDMVDNLQRLADGNLTLSVVPRDQDDSIRGALSKLGTDLQKMVLQIQMASHQINAASLQVADSSQDLSQGSTETASSLEQINSSVQEIASQAKLSAENAQQANMLAKEADVAAETGNAQMTDMITAMGEISAAGQSIGKIIKVIDEIAFQTNLLALNAAVEAARAGIHGKGFAVVAEEVRNLAARSAKAASETSELITNSVEKTSKGTQIAEQTSGALEKIVALIGKATDLMSEISISNNEQAQGIAQINLGLGQIDQTVQKNTATAEESAAASEELSSQAAHLEQMLTHFILPEYLNEQRHPQGNNAIVGRPHQSLPAWP